MTIIKGGLGFKGEKGDSAYQVAVQNGYLGTEQDWLSTLGTASHFSRETHIFTSTTVGQTEFEFGDISMANAFVDVYVEAERLNSDEYTLVAGANILPKIILKTPLDVVGTKVEAVILRMSTNSLPIVETIDGEATNETAPGTKAVYDLVNGVKTEVNKKINSSNIQVVTGSTSSGIPKGETKTYDISYPTGFTKDNTVILGKMVSSNNNYYETSDKEDTASGFPVITQIALTDSVIRVWIKNNSATEARIGYYKITLMKI